MVLNWNNICEWGNGESAYKLANAGYNEINENRVFNKTQFRQYFQWEFDF